MPGPLSAQGHARRTLRNRESRGSSAWLHNRRRSAQYLTARPPPKETFDTDVLGRVGTARAALEHLAHLACRPPRKIEIAERPATCRLQPAWHWDGCIGLPTGCRVVEDEDGVRALASRILVSAATPSSRRATLKTRCRRTRLLVAGCSCVLYMTGYPADLLRPYGAFESNPS